MVKKLTYEYFIGLILLKYIYLYILKDNNIIN